MAKLQVLLVDDNTPWLKYLTITLERDGFEVTCALDGPEAAAIIERNTYDAILSDMIMPGRNGLDLLRAARVRMPQARLILMSAYPLAPDQQKLANDLNVNFVAKPFGPDDIKPLLETLPPRTSTTVLKVAAAGRRRSERMPLPATGLRVCLADSLVVSDLNIARSAVDLSERGLGFVSNQALRGGTRLRISLLLPTKSVVEGEAVVRWCTTIGTSHRIGAEFLAVVPDRDKLISALRKSLSASDTKVRAASRPGS